MKSKIIFCICLCLLFFFCAYQNKITIPPSQSTNNDSCIENLKRYSYYWINDSVGENGFRELFAEEKLGGCKFSGFQWSTMSHYLGKPNFTFSDGILIHYRYRLNNYTDDLGAPGNMFLEIFVAKGIITSFKVMRVDG